jgi:hypothetical protein
MKILSIDVGMKHLAFCLFNIENKEKYTIDKWDVINLCKSTHEKKCMGKTKKGKCCDKAAKYYKDNEYYCKTHAKNHQYHIPTNNLKIKKIKKLKLNELKSLTKTLEIPLPNKKKIIKREYIETITEHLEKYYFNFIDKINTKDVNLIEYGRSLKNNFNDILQNIDVQCVIVENQIGPLALRMKTLQGMIMQHFIEKECQIVEEVSPLNKLKEFINNKKTSYSERKKMGIEVTKKLIKETISIQKWEQHFLKHAKKDDLADSYLQGIWYIKNTKLMNI